MAARHPPCRALKPKEKDYKVTDRDGMYVHVTAKGAMSFRMDYRLNGRRETRPDEGCPLRSIDVDRLNDADGVGFRTPAVTDRA